MTVATSLFGLSDITVPFEWVFNIRKGPTVLMVCFRDLSAMLSTTPSPGPQAGTHLQDVTSPSVVLSNYSGKYFSPGYGSFTICDLSATSLYCRSVLSAFDAVDEARSDPQPPPRETPQLFAAWPRLFATHLRFVHRDADTFDLAFTMLFPEGYGASRTPFETYEMDEYDSLVEFVIEDGKVVGFGLFGVADPGMAGDRREGVDIQDGAIAWFTKL